MVLLTSSRTGEKHRPAMQCDSLSLIANTHGRDQHLKKKIWGKKKDYTTLF